LVQQSPSRTQAWPRGAHWHMLLPPDVPTMPTPQQLVQLPLQLAPLARQLLHCPPSQRPLQQSVSFTQTPLEIQAQVPPAPQLFEQQSPPLLQPAPVLPQPQAPVLGSQLPEQQSPSLVQATLRATQAHSLLPPHLSVQQSPSLVQAVPPALH